MNNISFKSHIMNNLFKSMKLLFSVLLGAFVCFTLVSCEDAPTVDNLIDEEITIDDSLEVIEPLFAIEEIDGGIEGVENLRTTLLRERMIVIRDQETLNEMLPDMADEIDIEGNMLILAGVGLRSGSAYRVLDLYHNMDDDTYICRVTIRYSYEGTCDAPFVILGKVYPSIEDSITFEVVEL